MRAQFCRGVLEIGQCCDVVSVEHGTRLVTRNLHRDRFRDTSAEQKPNPGTAKVVELPIRFSLRIDEPALNTRIHPSAAKIFDSRSLPVKHILASWKVFVAR